MVKSILRALINNCDRINCMTLIPWALDYIDSCDAQFETTISSKIQTLKLFYKHDTVTNSIGFVFYHNELGYRGLSEMQKIKNFGVFRCQDML